MNQIRSTRFVVVAREMMCRPTPPAAATLVAAFAVISAWSQAAKGQSPGPRKSPGDRITTETVALSVREAKFSCYFARPAGPSPAPGLLLVHEWWGLNDWVKRQADRFARNGYAALAVDLYRGETAADAEHAHELMRGLTDERATADLKVAFDFLSTHPATQARGIGVIGWCMGGGLALKFATVEPRLACSVICYGKPITVVKQLGGIKGPLLGIWGAQDRGIEVAPFRKALKEAGVEATHRIYPGARHAFMNENNRRGYNPQQARKAWKEIDAFLETRLKKRKNP